MAPIPVDAERDYVWVQIGDSLRAFSLRATLPLAACPEVGCGNRRGRSGW